MVLVSSKKYACETCIKGHRSSACKHTDRPLFEIKKKGRPVTQCEHCRELRKTKQVHVKCLCEAKEEGAAPKAHDASGLKKKGSNKVPESAAFPNGLPEALGISVAVRLPSDGSSDSDHSGECACKDGGDCTCCTPRKSVSRHRRKDSRNSNQLTNGSDGNVTDSKSKRCSTTSSNLPLSSHILARIAELRPVLPRPPASAGPLHDPSSGIAHGSGVRHHTHENMYFSPYGRAYEQAHVSDRPSYDRKTQDDPPHPTVPVVTERPETIPQPVRTEWPADGTFPSMCGCGDECACPGCKEHNGSAFNDNANAFASCANPDACTACLDCTITSVASALPSETPLSMYEVDESIDEWLRQMASLPSTGVSQSASQAQVPSQLWNALQVPHIPDPASDCSSDCHCPPGLCTCHRQQLTFAVSGERGCYSPATCQREDESSGRQENLLTVAVDDNHSPSSQISTAHGQGHLRQIISRPTALSSTSSLASRSGSNSSVGYPKGAEANTSREAVYALSNPDSEPPPHEEYTSAGVYANSNPDSEHPPDEFECRQPAGVYAMSNPDSELSHEEFEYDPRFDYTSSLMGTTGAGAGEGENHYPISNPDSEVSLENFEQYPYDPSLDGMQLY